jgi:hypothetical protein
MGVTFLLLPTKLLLEGEKRLGDVKHISGGALFSSTSNTLAHFILLFVYSLPNILKVV